MKHLCLFFLAVFVLFASSNCKAQPYSGTIFIDPDIITSAEISTIVSTTYTGQGMRTVYDRRVSAWISINAYLFDIVWDDGLTSEAQINPEFGSVVAATIEAEKYALIVGQLPACLREDVDALWIHLGTEPFGGGNSSILIHTGQSALYEAQGILEETLVHEASHTSLDATHAFAPGWVTAQGLDSTAISTYAASNPTTEDISESFLTWLAVRQCSIRISQQDYDIITQTIPNRNYYFDNQNFNMYPLCMQATGTEEVSPEDFSFYLNPSIDFLTVNSTSGKEYQFVEIYTIEGRLILMEAINNSTHTIDINKFEKGIYLLVLISNEGRQHTKKWIKI